MVILTVPYISTDSTSSLQVKLNASNANGLRLWGSQMLDHGPAVALRALARLHPPSSLWDDGEISSVLGRVGLGANKSQEKEEKVYAVDNLKNRYYQLKKQHRIYGTALPESMRSSENWRFDFRRNKFIENKTWHARAVGYTRGELMIELCYSDIYGNKSEYAPLILHLKKLGDDDLLLNFLGHVLNDLASEIESRYKRLIDQLPAETKELSHKILELLNATEFEKDELRDQIKVWTRRASERASELERLERYYQSQLRSFHKAKGDKLHRLQRTIEREARNILSTKSFLGTKSKGLQGIRERLMNAISEEALGEDSIYHDHEPPEDLMPKQKKPVPMPKEPIHSLAKL